MTPKQRVDINREIMMLQTHMAWKEIDWNRLNCMIAHAEIILKILKEVKGYDKDDIKNK